MQSFEDRTISAVLGLSLASFACSPSPSSPSPNAKLDFEWPLYDAPSLTYSIDPVLELALGTRLSHGLSTLTSLLQEPENENLDNRIVLGLPEIVAVQLAAYSVVHDVWNSGTQLPCANIDLEIL